MYRYCGHMQNGKGLNWQCRQFFVTEIAKLPSYREF